MSIELALQLADEIVSAQGAPFVRELLRTLRYSGDRVTIGLRKSDTLANLRDAILRGFISYDDLVTWLRNIEGWGHQHVYMYKLSSAAMKLPYWTEESSQPLIDYARSCGIPMANERHQVLQFPENLRLGRLAYEDGKFELVWRKGTTHWRRDSSRDEERVIDEDRYLFEAWRETPERSVVRFTCFPKLHKAVLFVQVPLGEEHQKAVDQAFQVIWHFCPKEELLPLALGDCIKPLDRDGQEEYGSRLPGGRGAVRPTSATFRKLGASVAFNSTDLPSYASVPEVRRVRRALREGDFDGENATFTVELNSGTGMNRSMRMSLDGRANRAYLFAKMTEDEVWAIIDHLFDVTE